MLADTISLNNPEPQGPEWSPLDPVQAVDTHNNVVWWRRPGRPGLLSVCNIPPFNRVNDASLGLTAGTEMQTSSPVLDCG